jgi:hypothetical protein
VSIVTESPASAFSNQTSDRISMEDTALASTILSVSPSSPFLSTASHGHHHHHKNTGKLKKTITARITSPSSELTEATPAQPTHPSNGGQFKSPFAMSSSNVNSAKYFTISASAGQKFRQIIKKYV